MPPSPSPSQRYCYAFLDVDCVVCKFDESNGGVVNSEHDRIVATATRAWFRTLDRSIVSRHDTTTFVVATAPTRDRKRHGIHLYAQGQTVASLGDSIDAFVRELTISRPGRSKRTSLTLSEDTAVGCFPLLLDKNCVRPDVKYLEESNSTYTPVRVFSTDPRADRRVNRMLTMHSLSSFSRRRRSLGHPLEDYLHEDQTLREIHGELHGAANVSAPLPSFVTTLNNLRDNAVCREVATVVYENFYV